MTYLILLLFVIFISWISVYLDGRLNDKYKTKSDYVKTIAFAVVTVFGAMYLLVWLSPTGSPVHMFGGGKTAEKITGNLISVNGINEQMLSGQAPF